MEISVTFRHSETSPAIQKHIRDKIQKLSKYFIKPTNAHITLNVEGTRHAAEISFAEDHSVLNAHVVTHDMYVSVDRALEKLETQLKKYKEKLKNHHKKPKRNPAPVKKASKKS